MDETGKRINVVVRFSALGDLILTTGFLQKLHAERPDEEIVFATSAPFRELVNESFPVKTHVLTTGKHRLGILGYFIAGMQAYRKVAVLKPARIDLFDLHNVSKSRLWSLGFRWAALGSLKTSEFVIDKHRLSRWKLVRFKTRKNAPYYVYLEAQKLLAGSANFRPTLKVRAERPAGFSILMALDAQHWKKIWPSERWIQLLSLIHNSNLKNVHITLVGQHTDVPKLIPESLLSSGKFTVENLVGKTALAALPEIAAAHHVCICGNSAWQHLSEAVGTPVLSLLGPLDSEFGFSPYLERSQEFAVDLDCRPCTLHGGGACRLENDRFHACMRDIEAKQVYSALVLMGVKPS